MAQESRGLGDVYKRQAGKLPDRKDHPPVAATLGCGDERKGREQQQEQYSSSAVEHDLRGLRNVCLITLLKLCGPTILYMGFIKPRVSSVRYGT